MIKEQIAVELVKIYVENNNNYDFTISEIIEKYLKVLSEI